MIRIRTVTTGVAGTPWYSNYYFVGDTQEVADAAAERVNGLAFSLTGVTVNELTITVEELAVAINPATGETFDFYTVDGDAYTGINTQEPLPFQVQARTVFNTTGVVNGRRVRGASFCGGLGETISTTGIGPDAVVRGQIEGAYIEHFASVGTGSHCVWSRPVTVGDDTRAGSTHLVTSYATSPIWSTLRSRRAS